MPWKPLTKDEEALFLDMEFENEEEAVSQDLGPDEDNQTVIHCHYHATKYIGGGWVNIWPSTFLVHEESGLRISLLFAFGICLAPEKYYFKKWGERKSFTLLFPAIPRHWEKFSLVEECPGEDGFRIEHIHRNDTGVYHVDLN